MLNVRYGPLLTSIFMISLEEDLVPTLKLCLCNWKRYVVETHAYIEPTKAEFTLNKLNNYHLNIEFRFELEESNEINFSDVHMKRVNNSKLEIAVYQKPTILIFISTGIHMHQ